MPNTRRPSRKAVSRVLASMFMASAATGLAGLASAPALAQEARNYAIPAGELTDVLNRFARQAGVELAYDAALTNGVSSKGLTGSYAPVEALSRILAGTGITYRQTGTDAFTLEAAPDSDAETIRLGALRVEGVDNGGSPVSGAASGEGFTPDTPYRTPGSSAHISREQLDRVPPISSGDIFASVAGVISAGNRVGASINPNIRGLQGMGRVRTTIDGASQTASTYRGYTGSRDEVYLDPDMIGGVDITKGPSDGVGVGGIGGTIALRTLSARDIVPEGDNYGVRLKIGTSDNSVTPDMGSDVARSRPSSFNGDAYSWSVAAGTVQDDFEFLAAFSRRKSGNYFAGGKLYDELDPELLEANIRVPHADGEVFNTSEDTSSLLLKGKKSWGDGHSLELSYLLFDSESGEQNDVLANNLLPWREWGPTTTHSHTWSSRYRYNPDGSDLINLRANLWMSDVSVEGYFDASKSLFENDTGYRYGIRTLGGDVGNTALFDTAAGALTVNLGGEFMHERSTATQTAQGTRDYQFDTNGPSGTRLMLSGFAKGVLEPTGWLRIGAGLRYDHYNSRGLGYLARYPKRSGGRVSPNADVTLTPIDGVQLFAQYAEGYRPPSLRESHWNYSNLLQNNPDLGAERSRNYELGVNLLQDGLILPGDALRFKFAWFDNNYEDYIVRIRPGTLTPRSAYWFDNIDSAEYRGFELSGGYDIGMAYVEAAYTEYDKIAYCLTSDECGGTALANDYASNYIPPKYSGSVTAGIRLFDRALELGGRARFGSKRYGTDTVWDGALIQYFGGSSFGNDAITWPSYTIYDLFGSVTLNDRFQLNFSLENIEDDYYFGSMSSVVLASPGRTARIGITARLGDSTPFLAGLPFDDFPFFTSPAVPFDGDWSGPYVGGHLGYGFVNSSGTTTLADGSEGPRTAGEAPDFKHDDLTGGVHLGFNYQLPGRIVAGLEADMSWSGMQRESIVLATEDETLVERGYYEAHYTHDFNWMASVRARLGYALGSTLLYGTGGLAFLEEEQTREQYEANSGSASRPFGTSTVFSFAETERKTRQGWTLGGGIERALGNNWSVRGEYSYARFGKENFAFPDARGGVGQAYNERVIVDYRQIGDRQIPVYGYVEHAGSFDTVEGRRTRSSLDLHGVRIGITYRF